MYKSSIKAVGLALGLGIVTTQVSAELYTPKAVINNSQSSDIVHAAVRFPSPVTGDLYVAVLINQKLYFFANNGQQVTPEFRPFAENQDFSTDLTILDLNGNAIPAGNYPFYQIVTLPGSDPLNFANWIGGPSSLSSINFNVGFPVEINGDFNNDGFADDDANHDGFHDDDQNKDGYHDDDLNHDGYHDNDLNFNGIPDNLENNGPDGQALYDSNCAACHGSTPDANARVGTRPSEIRDAINQNKGGMGFLSGLTDAELQAISDYIKTF